MGVFSRGPAEVGQSQSIGAAEILAFLKGYSWCLIAGAVLGLAGGFVAVSLVPKQWEATVVLQIGRVSVAQSQGQIAYINVETPVLAAARVGLPEFQQSILRTLQLPYATGENRNTDLLRRTVEAKPVRDTDLVGIAVRGYSGEDALRFIDAIQNELVDAHAKLARPSLERLQAQSDHTVKSLEAARQQGARLAALAGERKTKGVDDFAENVLLNQMMADVSKQIQSLRDQQIQLQEQMNPNRSFITRPISKVIVSQDPVFPRRSIFASLGVIVGLGIAFLISLLFANERRNSQR